MVPCALQINKLRAERTSQLHLTSPGNLPLLNAACHHYPDVRLILPRHHLLDAKLTEH